MSKRADRRDSSYDNAVKYPQSRQAEPMSSHEMKQLIATLRGQKLELQEKLETTEEQFSQVQQQYVAEQERYQSALVLYQEEQQKYQSTLVLYQEAQQQSESYLSLYSEEKNRYGELVLQFETVQTERNQYLTLYNESQEQLKFERRSKAGIKSWETRRKRENERLKKEIGEMALILRDSLERRDLAVSNLESMAQRMDRIQNLVDSVESSSTDNPVGLVQKFRKIWQAIQDILSE